ncbi:hypothetical protein StrepF001_14985 [Streptomyces sp. F001]|uniref:hypothetical protein n=1 Tax=Streptomyces sp. F001 TaxID=1510026 RepID=UPI00101E3A62|nr:hypothetical protein [Streptomyces sp. F001]RZB18382.1 hypothetical protein StrepF001_14985 [Streptomyces sp. F001]
MLTPEDASFITAAVEGLASPLHAAFDAGYTNAHAHYDDMGMTGDGYSKGRTDLTRDHARRHLELQHEEGADLGGWQPIKSASGRLHLQHGMMSMRVLHATPFDLVPAPGRNKARISFYRNQTIDLFGVHASNLLGIWLSPPEEGGEISIRIVRPIGEWKPGRPPKFDLDLVLPRDTETFTGWEFIPDDQGLELPFEFDEDLREEGEGNGA